MDLRLDTPSTTPPLEMLISDGRSSAARAGGAAPDARNPEAVRSAAREMEELFLYQLLRAMRATVPHDGIVPQRGEQTTYEELLDQSLAAQAAERGDFGLGRLIADTLLRGRTKERDEAPAGVDTYRYREFISDRVGLEVEA